MTTYQQKLFENGSISWDDLQKLDLTKWYEEEIE